jgi:hypothetical protein
MSEIPFELTHEGPLGVPEYIPMNSTLEDGYWQERPDGWYSWQPRPEYEGRVTDVTQRR